MHQWCHRLCCTLFASSPPPPPGIFQTPVALSRAYESAELIKARSRVAANERREFPTTADLPGFPAPQSCSLELLEGPELIKLCMRSHRTLPDFLRKHQLLSVCVISGSWDAGAARSCERWGLRVGNEHFPNSSPPSRPTIPSHFSIHSSPCHIDLFQLPALL